MTSVRRVVGNKIWAVQQHDTCVITGYDLFWEKWAAEEYADTIRGDSPDLVDVFEVEVQ